MIDKTYNVKIECITEGFDKAIEEVETLADAYDGFPAQVTIRNCRDCKINVYPSQTKIIGDLDEGNNE